MKKHFILIIILLLPLITVSAQFDHLITQVRWSPDGTQLSYWMDGDIWLVNADGSNPRNMTDIIAEPVNPAQWSSDGAYLVFWYNSHLWSMSAADNRAINGLTFTLAEQPSDAAISPQGNLIAYSTPTAVYVQQVPDGEPQLLTSGMPVLTGTLRWSPDGQRLAFLVAKNPTDDASTPTNTLWVVNADGSNLHQLQIIHTAQSIRWIDNAHLMLAALTGFGDPGILLSYTGISDAENTIDYLNANQLTPSFDAATYSLSPNGQFLAYSNYELQDLDQDGSSIEATFTLSPEIIVLEIASRQQSSILPTDTAAFDVAQAIYWLDDASFVFLNQCDIGIQSLWLMSLTGEGHELLPCREGQMSDLSVSPDKQVLSFVAEWEGRRHIYRLNISDSALLNLNVP